MTTISILKGLRELAPHYQVLVCDIWGVLHNGHNAYEGVVDCLKTFRESHGLVLLLSNAPRPSGPIREQLQSLGVPAEAYDTIVTSGDLTRKLLKEKSQSGQLKLHHVGPDRCQPLFDGINVVRVSLDEASAIVCTGPFDDTREGPDDYRDYWHKALLRKLPFYCANPDFQVQRGDQLIYCAGALAQDYERRGGTVTYLGKPHLPVYEFVANHLQELTGRTIARKHWLAIGDGLKTDILGATSANIDALLITGGIHEAILANESSEPDPVKIDAVLKEAQLKAIGAMRRLIW